MLPQRGRSQGPARSNVAAGRAAERRVRLYYRLRCYQILDANARVGGNELDLVVRRGRRLVFCEVKMRSRSDFGAAAEMVGPEKCRRLRRAASAWLGAHPQHGGLEISFEVLALESGRIDRIRDAF